MVAISNCLALGQFFETEARKKAASCWVKAGIISSGGSKGLVTWRTLEFIKEILTVRFGLTLIRHSSRCDQDGQNSA